jgi:hypothetical protein
MTTTPDDDDYYADAVKGDPLQHPIYAGIDQIKKLRHQRETYVEPTEAEKEKIDNIRKEIHSKMRRKA